MRDNDGKYPAQFDEVLKSSGAKIKRNTPWSPNLRAHVERVIQTLRQEVLDPAARRDIGDYLAYYNLERKHSSLGYLSPHQFELHQTGASTGRI